MNQIGASIKHLALLFVFALPARCDAAALRRVAGKALNVGAMCSVLKRTSIGAAPAVTALPSTGNWAPQARSATWLTGKRIIFTTDFIDAAAVGNTANMQLFLTNRLACMEANFLSFIAEADRNKWWYDALRVTTENKYEDAFKLLLQFRENVLNRARKNTADLLLAERSFGLSVRSITQDYDQQLAAIEALMTFLGRSDVHACYCKPGTCLKNSAGHSDFSICWKEGKCCLGEVNEKSE